MNTIGKDNRYTRIEIIPSETYTCGCSYRGEYTVLFPTPGKVHHLTCPTHGSPIATKVGTFDLPNFVK